MSDANEIVALDNMDDILTHYGVKGMKWGKAKVGDPAADNKVINKYGDTAAEFNARQKMIDAFLKTSGKGDGKASGKGGGGKGKKGGGKGKKKAAGKKKSGASKSGSVNSNSGAVSSTTTTTPISNRSSYPARRAIEQILGPTRSQVKTVAPDIQTLIDEINASVAARKAAIQHGELTYPGDPMGHSDIKTEGGVVTDNNKELVTLDSLDDVLAHYGILGMKWGVRNDERSSGRPQGAASRKKAPISSVKKMVSRKSSPKESKATVSNTNNNETPTTTSDVSVATSQQKTTDVLTGNPMSDQELRDAINRLQMEKTYKQLMAERNPAPPAKTKSVISTILRDSTKQAAGQLLSNTLKVIGTYAIAAAISKQNPSLANALMKGVGDMAVAKKAAADASSTNTDNSSAPDATVHQPTQTSQPKQPKSNLGVPKVDAWVDKTATKITDDMMSTIKNGPTTSPLDLGPTPQIVTNLEDIRRAYRNQTYNLTHEDADLSVLV